MDLADLRTKPGLAAFLDDLASRPDLLNDLTEEERALCMAELSRDAATDEPVAPVPALDRYIAEYVETQDLCPTRLRRRLGLCAIMGGVPAVLAIGVYAAQVAGFITSGNGVTFAGFLTHGCLLTSALAIIVAIQATVETHVHHWLAFRSAHDLNTALAAAIRELRDSNGAAAAALFDQLRRHPGVIEALIRLNGTARRA